MAREEMEQLIAELLRQQGVPPMPPAPPGRPTIRPMSPYEGPAIVPQMIPPGPAPRGKFFQFPGQSWKPQPVIPMGEQWI